MFKIQVKEWENLYKNVPIQPITNNKTKKQITAMYNQGIISKTDYRDLMLGDTLPTSGGGKNVASTVKPLVFNQKPSYTPVATCHTTPPTSCGAYSNELINWQAVTPPLHLTEKQVVQLVTTGKCSIIDVNGTETELEYEGPRMLDFQIHELDLGEDEI